MSSGLVAVNRLSTAVVSLHAREKVLIHILHRRRRIAVPGGETAKAGRTSFRGIDLM
jgi:hypothetical protein